jgi:lysophospholipase L1-like esterase
MAFSRAAKLRGFALTARGSKARRTRPLLAVLLALSVLLLINLRSMPADAADGIALSSWSVTVGGSQSVTVTVTTTGGGGLVPRGANTPSIVGYVCVIAATGETAFGTAVTIGKEDLVSGSTYRIGPVPAPSSYPPLKCFLNSAYLYGEDGSSRKYSTAEELAAVSGDSAPPTGYVAMGDSYSSGEGVPEFIPPSDTNECHRSEHAYSKRFVERSDWPGPFSFVACSGAKIGNFYHGQNRERSQLSSLDDTTKLISLTVGGNDIEFANITRYCFFDLRCQQRLNVPTRALIAYTSPRLKKLYQSILEEAPNADIYVLGYPRFFSPNPSIFCNGIDVSEARWMNRMTDKLNQQILNQVKSLHNKRLHYVDTANAFAGGELCSSDSPVYMNGTIAAHREYSFHPTERGQGMLAGRLFDAVEETA